MRCISVSSNRVKIKDTSTTTARATTICALALLARNLTSTNPSRTRQLGSVWHNAAATILKSLSKQIKTHSRSSASKAVTQRNTSRQLKSVQAAALLIHSIYARITAARVCRSQARETNARINVTLTQTGTITTSASDCLFLGKTARGSSVLTFTIICRICALTITGTATLARAI